MDLRFWLSIIGVFLIAGGTAVIYFFLKSQDSSSHLAPTLGLDALDPPLKRIYRATTLLDLKNPHDRSRSILLREIRRAIFELQINATLGFKIDDHALTLEEILEDLPHNEGDFEPLIHQVRAIRAKKKAQVDYS